MKKYFGFLIVLTLFVLGGAQAHAAASVPGPCVSTASPSITVLSPNGGETYVAGQQITIKWKSCNISTSPNVSKTNIYLIQDLPNGGTSLTTYLYNSNGNGWFSNNGIQSVVIPTSVVFGKYKINVAILGDDNFLAATGTSDPFTIKTSEPSEVAPYIKVVSPNGGENIDIASPVTITFKSNNPEPAKHYINLVDVTTDHAYSLDSLLGSYGLTFTQEQINQGEQSVTFSAPESIKLNTTHDYLIEICVKNICDKSDGTFKLVKSNLSQAGAIISVASPNGGEKFAPGKKITVRWKTKNILTSEKVVIVLDAAADTTVDGYNMSGSEGTLNDGSETFTLPSDLVGKFKVRILRLSDKSIYDTSDNFFTIVKVGKVTPSDIIIAPNQNVNSDSPSSNIPGTGVLKKGIKNASVIAIQNALIKLGYSVTADGSFGPKTEGAIKEIQIKNNLKADGVIGPKTMLLFK